MSLPVHPEETAAAVAEISHEDLVTALSAGSVLLVDVLARESFLSGHVPGARSLPLADLPRRAREVLPDLRTPVVAYCGGWT